MHGASQSLSVTPPFERTAVSIKINCTAVRHVILPGPDAQAPGILYDFGDCAQKGCLGVHSCSHAIWLSFGVPNKKKGGVCKPDSKQQLGKLPTDDGVAAATLLNSGFLVPNDGSAQRVLATYINLLSDCQSPPLNINQLHTSSVIQLFEMHALISLSLMLASASVALADCCYPVCSTNGECHCADGTPATPYCGVGKCNIFGCNCDGGMFSNSLSDVNLSRSVLLTIMLLPCKGCRQANDLETLAADAQSFAAADTDGTGNITLAQFLDSVGADANDQAYIDLFHQ